MIGAIVLTLPTKKFEENLDEDDDLTDNMTSITLQDVESRLIKLDPTIQDTMWYV